MAFLDSVLFDAAAKRLKPTPAQMKAASVSDRFPKKRTGFGPHFCRDPVPDYHAADEIIHLYAVLFACFHSYLSKQAPIVSLDDLKILHRPP